MFKKVCAPKNVKEQWIDLTRINKIEYLSRVPFGYLTIYYDKNMKKVELDSLSDKDISKLIEIFKSKELRIEKKGRI